MENTLSALLKKYDSYDYYIKDKIKRDTEEYRKGQFALVFTDSDGNTLDDVKVSVKQVRHEFKFGGTTFYLNGFTDDMRNKEFERLFTDIFNYAVIPVYWDTLELVDGQERFLPESPFVSRRPPIDTCMDFCRRNSLRAKAHCLVYNSFQPDWIPENNRDLKIRIDKRIRRLAEHCGDFFEDIDVINEMISIYKNCYKGNAMRNMQIADEHDHEKWAFQTAEKYFPYSRLFWNEGGFESFANPNYRGHRSFYYMTLKDNIAKGAPIGGIGMQFHCYSERDNAAAVLDTLCNPLRLIDVFDCYGAFGLPMHISEVNIPSWSNEAEDEFLQAELTERLYRLWFSSKNVESAVWWTLADGTAYPTENVFYGGLIRNDCTPKPAYERLDRLINSEWNTSFEVTADKRLDFRGFYGDYVVSAECGGKTCTQTLRLYHDTTGFDNRLCDFRSKRLVLT